VRFEIAIWWIRQQTLAITAMDIDPSALPSKLTLAGAVFVLLLVVLVGMRVFSRRRQTPMKATTPPAVDINQLGTASPPTSGPQLNCYNVPVRLVMLVIAPSGRDGCLPADSAIAATVDHAIPGLAKVMAAHQTPINKWPRQLSSAGFTHAFFKNCPLPGRSGRGTPWCSAAGPFQAHDKRFLIGLVMRSSEPNNLGQYAIEQESQWLDAIRAAT
jgi:hypothetical protein